MKIAILTECGSGIGYGHLSRCYSIYQNFVKKSVKVDLIIDCKDKKINLPKIYLRSNWTKNHFSFNDLEYDVLIFDSYNVTKKILVSLSKNAKVNVFIDDYNRIDYPKGIIINSSIGAKYLYRVKKNIIYLCGPNYTILREVFTRKTNYIIKDKIDTVLLSFGGADLADSLCYNILKFLKDSGSNYKFIILQNSFSKKYQKYFLENALVYTSVNQDIVKKIMMKVDLAIIAPGQIIYELASIGVPVIPIVTAENQKIGVKAIYNKKVIAKPLYIDDNNICRKLQMKLKTLENKSKRIKTSNKMKLIFNKNGVDLIFNEIRKYYKTTNKNG